MRKATVFILGIFIAACGSAEASTLSIATNAHVRHNNTQHSSVVRTQKPNASVPGDQTWTGTTSGNWNIAGNWDPPTIPNGDGVTANFDATGAGRTAVTISAPVTVGSIVFAVGSPSYTFTIFGTPVTSPAPLTLSGVGLENDSGVMQTFNNSSAGSASPNYGRIVFTGSATISGPVTLFINGSYTEPAGPIPPFNAEVVFTNDTSAGSNQTIINAQGGLGAVLFQDDASAGSATINANGPGGGYAFFVGNSTADDATININVGGLEVTGNSTLDNATVNNNAGSYFVEIAQNATAGNATIIDNGSYMAFLQNGMGGTATITQNTGTLTFTDSSDAQHANITVNGGLLQFVSTAYTATSGIAPTAGDATITINAGGTLAFNPPASSPVTTAPAPTAGNAQITNAGIISFYTASTAGSSTITNSGTLNFFDTSTAGDATILNNTGGVVDISGLTSTGMTAGSIAGAGNFDLGGAQLTVGSNNSSTTVDGVIADGGASGGTGGSLVKVGSGLFTLNADNTYTGGTTVDAGTLVVGDPSHTSAALSGGGPITIASGATLGGFGSVNGSVTNNGTLAAGNATPGFSSASPGQFTINGDLFNNATVSIASDPSSIGNVLEVNGNYIAAGAATLKVNTFVNAGGPLSAQLTDRLLIFGNASGTTNVLVNGFGPGEPATGFPTAADGFSLVQVAGMSSQDAFVLPGGVTNAGTPYEYALNAYGPGSSNGLADPTQSLVGNPASHWDYRLQTVYVDPEGVVTPEPSPVPTPPDVRPESTEQVPSYLTAPVALFNAGFQDIDSLHRRLGEIRDDQILGISPKSEMFLRGYGTNLNYTSNQSFTNFGFDSSQDYGAIQLGINWIASTTRSGTLRLGVAGTQGWLSFSPFAVDGHSNGNFKTQSLAGTVTWQSQHGWYLDGIFMAGTFNGKVSTFASGETVQLNGWSTLGSLEAGYPFHIGSHGLELEPQLQFVYQHLSFPTETDSDGIVVALGNPDQGILRGGFRLIRPTTGPNGARFTPYFNANVLQGIGGGANVQFANIPFTAGHFGTAVQLGGGVTGTISNNFSAHADISWMQSVGGGFGTGAAGFRGWAYNGELRWIL